MLKLRRSILIILATCQVLGGAEQGSQEKLTPIIPDLEGRQNVTDTEQGKKRANIAEDNKTENPKQQAGKSEDPEEAEDEVYIMSDFEVTAEGDQGYYSANTTGATRANTLIKNTPMTLTVVNEEMMEDLNIIMDQDLELVSPSIEAEMGNWTLGKLNIRGFSGGARYDLFRRVTPRDSYNVNRLDIIRGANSLIYGQAAPGGRINYVPKTAMFNKNSLMLNSALGNKDYSRSFFDYNRVFSDKFAVRLMGVSHKQGYRQTYRNRKLTGATIAASFRPSERTQLRLHLEAVDSTLEFTSNTMSDVTFLDATGIIRYFPYSADAINLLPEAAREAINEDATNIANGINTQTLSNYYSKINANDYGSYEGPDVPRDQDGYFSIFEWSQQLGDNLQFRIGYQHERYYQDAISRASSGTVRLADPTQQTQVKEPYLITYFTKADNEQLKDGVRSSLIWDFELKQTKHTLVTGYDFDYVKTEGLNYDLVFEDRLNSNGSYMQYRADRGNTTLGIDVLRLSDGVYGPNIGFDMFSSNPYGIRAFTGNAHQGTLKARGLYRDGDATIFALRKDNKTQMSSHGLWSALQSEFLNGRLLSLCGIRYDTFDLDVSELLVYENGYDGERETISSSKENFSSTFGVLYWLTEELGVFGNFSQSINSPNVFARTVFGELPEPELGAGFEYGLRFSLMKGKLNGQIVGFYIEKENDTADKFTDGEIRRYFPASLYPQLYEPGSDTELLDSVGDRINGVFTRANGCELEFYYNPSRSITFTCAYNYTNYDRIKFPDNITDLGAEQILGQSPHRATMVGKYTFNKKGKLNGLSMGLNQRYRSGSVSKILQDFNGNELGELKFKDEWVTGCFANYDRRLGSGRNAPKLGVRFSISNLFNKKDLVNRTTRAMYHESRSYNLNVKISF